MRFRVIEKPDGESVTVDLYRVVAVERKKHTSLFAVHMESGHVFYARELTSDDYGNFVAEWESNKINQATQKFPR